MADIARLILAAETAQMDQAATSLDRVTASGAKTEAAAKRAGAAVTNAGRQAQVAGNQIRGAGAHTANLGAQFNDIGVMLAAGQNPLMLAMQQGTQINQVFDQMGAGQSRIRALGAAFMSVISPASLVTIGIIAGGAALAQWGISALSAGRETRELSEVVDDLKGAMSALDRAQRDAAMSMTDLRAEYGPYAEQVREILELQRDLATVRALQAQRDAIRAITGEMDGLGSVVRLTNVQFAEQLTAFAQYDPALRGSRNLRNEFFTLGHAISDVTAELGISQGAALDFIAAMRDAASATSEIDRADALARARDALAQAAANGDELTDAAIDALEALTDAEIAAIGLSNVDTAGPIAAAAGAAAILSGNLWNAYSAAVAISRQNAQDAYNVPAGRGGDPRQFGSDYGSIFNQPGDAGTTFVQSGMARPSVRPGARTGIDFDLGPDLPTGGGAGGGGSSRDPIDELTRAYESLLHSLDPVARATADYAEAQKTVNDALAAGIISQGEATNLLALAKAEYDEIIASQEELTDAAKAGIDVMADLFDIVTGRGESAIDVAKRLALELARVRFIAGLTGLAENNSAFAEIASAVGGLFGLEGGTNFTSGGRYKVGEQGPEVVDLPAGAKVYTAGQSRNMSASNTSRMMQDGGSPGGSTVVFNISTPDVEGFRRSESQMAARAQSMLARGQRNS